MSAFPGKGFTECVQTLPMLPLLSVLLFIAFCGFIFCYGKFLFEPLLAGCSTIREGQQTVFPVWCALCVVVLWGFTFFFLVAPSVWNKQEPWFNSLHGNLWCISPSPGGSVLKRGKKKIPLHICLFLSLAFCSHWTNVNLLHQGWVWSSEKLVNLWDGAFLQVNDC